MDRLDGIIRNVTDPTVVMRRVVEQALVLIPQAEGTVVELLDGDCLTCLSGAGTLSEHVGIRVDQDASLSGLALRTGNTLRCDDATADARVDATASRRTGAISGLCVPLHHGHEPIGVLLVMASQPRAFDDDDTATLTRLGRFISAAVGAASELDRIAREGLAERATRDRAFIANVLNPGSVMDVETSRRIE